MDVNTKNIVELILSKVDPYRIYLFGSRARNESDPDSDYDICILFDQAIDKISLAKLLYQSFALYPFAIDLIIETTDTFDTNISNKYMIYKDISTGTLLYEKQ